MKTSVYLYGLLKKSLMMVSKRRLEAKPFTKWKKPLISLSITAITSFLLTFNGHKPYLVFYANFRHNNREDSKILYAKKSVILEQDCYVQNEIIEQNSMDRDFSFEVRLLGLCQNFRKI